MTCHRGPTDGPRLTGPRHDGTHDGCDPCPERHCQFQDCDGHIQARGVCTKHYHVLRNAPDWQPITAQPLIDRIMSRMVIQMAGHPTPCWLSTRAVGTNGYTHIKILNRQNRLLHRVAYELLVGPIPTGLTIDHLCRNKSCINPAHLEAVTQRVNSRRHYRRSV